MRLPPARLARPAQGLARRLPNVLFVLLGTLVAQVAAIRATALLLPQLESALGLVVTHLLLPGVAGLAWLWFALLWRHRHGWRDLGLLWPGSDWLRVSFLAAIGCFAIGLTLKLWSEPYLGPSRGLLEDLIPEHAEFGAPLAVALLLGAGVLAPVVEELLFRGLVYAWLRQRLSVWPAALLAALPHALLHFEPAALPSFIAIFVIAAWLYEVSGCLWCPIVAHAGHNLISLALVFATHGA